MQKLGSILNLMTIFVLLAMSTMLIFDPVSADGTDAWGSLPMPFYQKGNPKLDSELNRLVSAQSGGQSGLLSPADDGELAGNSVRVIVQCLPGQSEAAANAARELGTLETSYGDILQVLIPVFHLTALADASAVRLVQSPTPPALLGIVSEGVSVINAPDWHTAGYTGQGVKVAVLDVGFTGYAALLGTELPASVITRSFYAGSDIEGDTAHGTACAEILYDMAPDAQFYLVNFGTSVEMGNAIDWLIAQGVDIISCSIGWPVGGPGDGTGPICEMVDKARSAGILWVQAVGNYAQRHWAGEFRDSNDNGFIEFTYTDETNTISVANGSSIVVALKWNDAWGSSGNDYELLLYDKDLKLVAISYNTQDGDDDPWEALVYTATYTGLYHIAIGAYGHPSDFVYFHLYSYGHGLHYQTAPTSFAVPADSPNALAVGAVACSSPDTIEVFSSQGPTFIGRKKPDLVAPDGVSTATYGTGGFYGTSAAAPHAAGAAALVRERYPSYDATLLQAFLEANTVDLGGTGKDDLYGTGRLLMWYPQFEVWVDDGFDSSTPGWGVDHFDRIQSGIDALAEGGRVHVAAGTYFELIQLRSYVEILGAGTDSTIIDGDVDGDGLGEGSVVSAINVRALATLDGFTITHGTGALWDSRIRGGGIFVLDSSPIISNCVLEANSAAYGAGMSIMSNWYSSPVLTNCVFRNNESTGAGGGIYNWRSSPTVTNCHITSNTAKYGAGMYNDNYSSPVINECSFMNNAASDGGGIYNYDGSSPAVANCTIAMNSAVRYGGGMVNYGDCSPTIANCTFSQNAAESVGAAIWAIESRITVSNCVLWGDSPTEISSSAASVCNSDIQGGYPGTGNINEDPMFVDAASGDFHLQWGSPCIDSGTNAAVNLPATDFEGDPRILDGDSNGIATVDMGADEYVYDGATFVKINEFVSYPASGDWIELYNPMGNNVNLAGWTLSDSTSVMKTFSSGDTIASLNWLHVLVSNRLNRDGDDIILKTSGGVEIDRVTYGGTGNAPVPGSGQSAGRCPDGTDTDSDSVDFRIFDAPTPAAANACEVPHVDISVALQGSSRPDPAGWEIPVTVKFFTPGADVMNETPLYTFDATTFKSGDAAACQVTGISPGTYDITVVSEHTLMNVKRTVAVSAPSTSVDMGTLLEGDWNGNLTIDWEDLGTVLLNYDKSDGEEGFDPAADFNRNGCIDWEDLGLALINYDKTSPVEVP